MAGVDVLLITQIIYACTTQDKLQRSTIATNLQSIASKPLWAGLEFQILVARQIKFDDGYIF